MQNTQKIKAPAALLQMLKIYDLNSLQDYKKPFVTFNVYNI